MIQNKPNEDRAGWHNSGSTNLEEVRFLDAIVCLPVWLNTTNIHNLDLVINMALLDICVQLNVDQHYQDGYCTVLDTNIH